MKFKTNIFALLLAILVFASSNGVALFEHICNTANTRSYCLFLPPSCENEEPVSPCCEKMGWKQKKNCCQHKQFFSKLNIEGFTAKQFQLKTVDKKLFIKSFVIFNEDYSQQVFENHYSGIPPPDNLFTIKYTLRPSPIVLQVFRC